MDEQQNEKPQARVNPNTRRVETDRAFAEMLEKEQKERREKTIRLRKMRLMKQQ